MACAFLPIIDFGAYLDPASSSEKRLAVAHEIDKACRYPGMFYLTNHGVPQELWDKVRTCAHQFFQLPLEEKNKHVVASYTRGYWHVGPEEHDNRGEGIAFHPPVNCYSNGLARKADPNSPSARLPTSPDALGDQNSWPSDEFRAVTEEYLDHVLRVKDRVLEAIATSLDISNESLKRMQNTSMSATINGYPASAKGEAEQRGINLREHADSGCITFLNQDLGAASLQAQDREGVWRNVQPIPNAFVVNVGCVLNKWTGGQYIDVIHRVIHRLEKPRVSVVAFTNPPFDGIVEPLPEFAELCKGQAKYAPTTFGSFLLKQIGDYDGPLES
ncbi:hypothetical protein THASP1DRAFT_33591 [Thamnocephalis sphaerospora]|uniref:Fe2OG dioxygenase domain-containing protein n=1 Tax=Thamnocephalis sphaerospora TaxID=78915 RepID=A0A4V1IVM9_9FUNG|nr:hypothetical protein THASP1DRAFT_33591 [Thamnocephalis sphaerospora]|eukprot:RKP04619.1 hypothetical protein THASP1DRAFT_33591 [Thamnocephalis sphaerospora]